jgi:undecaprenyl diphosphate synthase
LCRKGERHFTAVTESTSSKTLHVASSHPLGAVTAEEAFILEKLDLNRLPRHLAVIMDGNGRWAQRRHLPRIAGHRKGTETARVTIETCSRLKLEALTLYAFSVENWRRPKAEIDFLMQLLREYIHQEMPLIQRNNIRMRFLGRAEELPAAVQRDTTEAMEATAGNTGMVLCIALNYGGRAEIVDAANALLSERKARGSAEKLTDEDIERHLYTAGLPNPDLLVRTSGELRVSNFLLWQIAYAEIFVTETLWPDFNRARLLESFVDFQKRDRRYGGIGESEESEPGDARIASS